MQKKLLIFFVVALILIIVAVFSWQTKQNSQTPHMGGIKPNITQEETYPQYIEAIQGSNEVWYNIPEDGVRMRLNKEFADDLIYSFVHEKNTDPDENWDAMYFSTKSLISVDKNCSTALGVLTKMEGNAQELAKSDEYIASRLDKIVQVGSYYYIHSGPQDVCWNSAVETEARAVFPGEYNGVGAKSISDGIKTLQSVPLK